MKRILKTIRTSILLLLACFSSNLLFAQSREIRGKVTSSEDNLALVGATVAIKGARGGVTTDAQGNY
ncbi:MAG TPA: hypothetical protein VI461_12005, partial [Chitinophagaceae bacterium]|nr:hypothetical protein [Chitinophagaceae bacterium]